MTAVTGADALTLQLLAWIAERPRSYAETLDAWKSSCPRLTIWEDAVAGGLVRVEGRRVALTPVGLAKWGGAREHPAPPPRISGRT